MAERRPTSAVRGEAWKEKTALFLLYDRPPLAAQLGRAVETLPFFSPISFINQISPKATQPVPLTLSEINGKFLAEWVNYLPRRAACPSQPPCSSGLLTKDKGGPGDFPIPGWSQGLWPQPRQEHRAPAGEETPAVLGAQGDS